MQEQPRADGRPLAVEDGMIAAICTSRSTILATRNTADFAGLDLELIDPVVSTTLTTMNRREPDATVVHEAQ